MDMIQQALANADRDSLWLCAQKGSGTSVRHTLRRGLQALGQVMGRDWGAGGCAVFVPRTSRLNFDQSIDLATEQDLCDLFRDIGDGHSPMQAVWRARERQALSAK